MRMFGDSMSNARCCGAKYLGRGNRDRATRYRESSRAFHARFAHRTIRGVAATLFALCLPVIARAVTDTWSAAGSFVTARSGHTATLLPSNQVLVVGGINGGYFASTQLYDPASNAWSAAASLAAARGSHIATLLPSGKVLVVGGSGNSGFLASAELYDPANNSWSAAGNFAITCILPT